MSNVTNYYDYLHTIPELGFQEIKTSAFITEKLISFGYDVITNLDNKTGIVAIWDSGIEGPIVGFRADMDALGHIIDDKLCARHTCGHDAHSSMLLATAEELKKQNLLKKGKVKFIFQPAEELGIGAQSIINSGIAKDLDYIFGAHVRPIEEASIGQAVSAVYYAASTRIIVEIKGIPAHGARPHLGVNAIDAAVLAINSINTIHLKPTESWSIKPTRLICDSGVTNSVPDRAHLVFDARAQYNSVMDELIEKAIQSIQLSIQSIGATCTIDSSQRIHAAVLDDEATEILTKSIIEVLGKQGLIKKSITPGGEDFFAIPLAYPHIKAGFYGLGCNCMPGLHHPDMTLDKSALENGVKIHLATLKQLVG